MDSAYRGTGWADVALSADFLNLIAENCPLYLFNDPLPILKAQLKSFWAGYPVRS